MTPDTTDVTRQEAGRRRIEAVRAQLEQHELDVLLVFGSGRHHFIGANLCWWLSGTRQLGRDALVAVTREGEAVLVTSPSWDEARTRRRGWISDVVAVDDIAAALPELARQRGWHGARVGLAGANSATAALNAAVQTAFERPPVTA
jgi:Xaa-Pro aminopeptidase